MPRQVRNKQAPFRWYSLLLLWRIPCWTWHGIPRRHCQVASTEWWIRNTKSNPKRTFSQKISWPPFAPTITHPHFPNGFSSAVCSWLSKPASHSPDPNLHIPRFLPVCWRVFSKMAIKLRCYLWLKSHRLKNIIAWPKRLELLPGLKDDYTSQRT